MHRAGNGNDDNLISDLNDLLMLDHDAVQAYTVAINLARDESIRQKLVDFRADHKRHIEELAGLIRDRGGLPLEMPHASGPLKIAVQTLGSLPSDETLLLAFKAVEGQVRDKYRRFARNSYPDEVGEVVRRGAADEETHYEWTESTLHARGVGEGTLPHGLARVVEGIHKVLADPVESVQREVAQMIGRMVGTTRSRGGSEAPSPVDVANEMAAGRVDQPDGMIDQVDDAVDQADGMAARAAERAADAMDRDRTGMRSGSPLDDVVVDSPIVGPSGRPAREELGEDVGGATRDIDGR